MVANDGSTSFMHKLILFQAFPVLKEMFDDKSDDPIVILIPDTSVDVIDACRDELYRSGNGEALEIVLGFDGRNDVSTDFGHKVENQEYVPMNVVHDYVDIDTLQEITSLQKKDLNVLRESFTQTEFHLKKPKKVAPSELPDIPYYFLPISKYF